MSTLFKTNRLQVDRVVVGPFDNNVYVVRDLSHGVCAIIDASFEPEHIIETVGKQAVVAILLTHAHLDHTQALEELRLKTKAPVGVHPQEPGSEELDAQILLLHGTRILVGSRLLEVLHTPGHTPGSVCFVLGKELCFCGDTLFPGGPGKTASPQDFLQIIKSIEHHIYTLPDTVLLLPGHGEGLTVGESKREYELFKKRPRSKIPFGDVLWEES